VAEKYVMLPRAPGRNLLLFGNPEYSHATARLLEQAPWTVAYDVSIGTAWCVRTPGRPTGCSRRRETNRAP